MERLHYETNFNEEKEKAGINELSDFSFEKNAHSLLEGYFRFIPSLKTHLESVDKLTPAELLAYNNNVAQILYGPRILNLFKNKQHDKITALSERVKEKMLQSKKETLESINFNNLALLLIRPESRFLTEDIKLFLQKMGTEIVLEHPLLVDLKQYWIMYNEGFLKSDLSDFPTRTLIYTCGESKILILRKKQSNLQNYLNSELKGVSGVHSKNPTIRGTVVLGGFEKAKKENEKLFYDSIDPLGMYRAITSGKIYSSDSYDNCDDPVLYYAGQGIHLPEEHELKTNTGVLLDNNQLKELSIKSKKFE